MVFGPFPNKTVALNLKMDMLSGIDHIKLATGWNSINNSIQFIDLDKVRRQSSLETCEQTKWCMLADEHDGCWYPSSSRATGRVLRSSGKSICIKSLFLSFMSVLGMNRVAAAGSAPWTLTAVSWLSSASGLYLNVQ